MDSRSKHPNEQKSGQCEDGKRQLDIQVVPLDDRGPSQRYRLQMFGSKFGEVFDLVAHGLNLERLFPRATR